MDTTELVIHAQKGNQQAITALYNLSYKPAYAVAFKMTGNEDDAFDVLQDAYIKAFNSLDQLTDPSGFIPWFNKITANKCRDFLRSKKNVIMFSDMEYDNGEDSFELEFEDESTAFQPEERADYSDTKRLVAEMLDNLPADQKMVLLMYYVQEMSIKEIAEALDISENTVKSRMSYGKKKMRAQAEDMEKKGYKLRVSAVAVVPFLIWMLREFTGAVAISPMSAAIGTAAGAAAAGTSAAAGTASSVSAGAATGAATGATAGAATGATAGVSAGAAVGAAVSAKAVALIAAGAVAVSAGSVGFFGFALPAMRGDDGWEVTPYSCKYDRGDPPEWQKRSDGKIYFYADPALWQNYEYIDIYLYDRNGNHPIEWGSRKGRMTDEGNNIWSYDIAQYGFTLDDNSSYEVIFSADWKNQSYDLIIGNDCLGDMAYLTGGSVENPVDPYKICDIAEWVNADPAVYATPVQVTLTGNVIGETLFKSETFYSTYCGFLENTIDRVIEYNGKTAKETADDVAKTLGLSKEERDRAFKETDITEQDGDLTRSGVPLAGFQIPDDGGHVMSLDEVKEHLDEFLEIGRSRWPDLTNADLVQLTYDKGELRYSFGVVYDNDPKSGASSGSSSEGSSRSDIGADAGYDIPYMHADGTVTIFNSEALPGVTKETVVLWRSDKYDQYDEIFG